MKLLNFDRVLCISPHPDDVELAMLSTILKYQDTRFEIITLSICGAKGFDESYKEDRITEINNLWQDSNATNVFSLKANCDYFEDKTEPGWINYLDEIVSNNYDCVFIPPEKDSMFEHRLVNSFGHTIVRNSPISLIEYHTISTLNTWIPNIFIDIEETYYNKILLIKHFKSQLHKKYFQEKVVLTTHTNTQCSKKGMNLIEKFRMVELLIK